MIDLDEIELGARVGPNSSVRRVRRGRKIMLLYNQGPRRRWKHALATAGKRKKPITLAGPK